MPTEWEMRRLQLNAEAEKAITALMEHMGELSSFQFPLSDGRVVKVSVSKASSGDAEKT